MIKSSSVFNGVFFSQKHGSTFFNYFSFINIRSILRNKNVASQLCIGSCHVFCLITSSILKQKKEANKRFCYKNISNVFKEMKLPHENNHALDNFKETHFSLF